MVDVKSYLKNKDDFVVPAKCAGIKVRKYTKNIYVRRGNRYSDSHGNWWAIPVNWNGHWYRIKELSQKSSTEHPVNTPEEAISQKLYSNLTHPIELTLEYTDSLGIRRYQYKNYLIWQVTKSF